MKNFRLLILGCIVAAFSSCATVKTSFSDTQARIQEVHTAAYAKPLTVELIVDTVKGRINDPWIFTKEEVEIDMRGDLTNVRSRAVYLSSQKHNADVIVAPMFNVETSKDGKGYQVTVTGFPAYFKNWQPAKESDYEWIRTEKFITPLTWEKVSAIVK